jgi:hypothetical protein
MLPLCGYRSMIELEERLLAAQREYDEVEAELLRKRSDFRAYLATTNQDERAQGEQILHDDAEFRRWRALAGEISQLYKIRDRAL